MIDLLTGTPGSGKTLFATFLIQQFLKEGRQVFTNINGLDIEGVGESPDDWRDAPEGSVVIYDECQMNMGVDIGRVIPDFIKDLAIHRHTGHDIVLITQGPKLIHPFIRPLVGRHRHIDRVFGTNNARVYRAESIIETISPSRLKTLDQIMWPYPKDNFKLYQSASVHTVKASFPARLKYAVGLFVFLLFGFGYFAYNSMGFWTGEDLQSQISKEVPSQSSEVKKVITPDKPEYNPVIPEVVAVNPYPNGVRGCFHRPKIKRCGCIDYNNALLDIDLTQCLNLLESGIYPSPPRRSHTRKPSRSDGKVIRANLTM